MDPGQLASGFCATNETKSAPSTSRDADMAGRDSPPVPRISAASPGPGATKAVAGPSVHPGSPTITAERATLSVPASRSKKVKFRTSRLEFQADQSSLEMAAPPDATASAGRRAPLPVIAARSTTDRESRRPSTLRWLITDIPNSNSVTETISKRVPVTTLRSPVIGGDMPGGGGGARSHDASAFTLTDTLPSMAAAVSRSSDDRNGSGRWRRSSVPRRVSSRAALSDSLQRPAPDGSGAAALSRLNNPSAVMTYSTASSPVTADSAASDRKLNSPVSPSRIAVESTART